MLLLGPPLQSVCNSNNRSVIVRYSCLLGSSQYSTARYSRNWGSLLAYSIDTDGSEHFSLRFRDIKAQKEIIEGIYSQMKPDVTYSFAWANDNQHVFYIKMNESLRLCKVLMHKIGTRESEDKIILE